MSIYLDNAAAMPVEKSIADAFAEYSVKYFANPESTHASGRFVRNAMDEAAERVCSALAGVDSGYKLRWSASATDAMNLLFSSGVFSGETVITSTSEHPALTHALERGNFCEIRKIGITGEGRLDLTELEEVLDGNVGVVALHFVQNETGAVQNLESVREIMDSKSSNALLVVDSVQAVAKIAVPWESARIDIAFIGGHKVGAPSGGAMIYNLREHRSLQKKLEGRLDAMRSVEYLSGRSDSAVCLALADAVTASDAYPLCKADFLSALLREELNVFAERKKIRIRFPVPEEYASPYIVTFLLPDFQAEILVRMLSDKGVMVSAGSACSASKEKPNASLLAMGVSPADARTSIRVSFSYHSSKEDVISLVSALESVVEQY